MKLEKRKKAPAPKANPRDAKFYKELNAAILEFTKEGIDPTIGVNFKKSGSRNNGLYQAYMKRHKGERNSWKIYVQNLLKQQQGGAQ